MRPAGRTLVDAALRRSPAQLVFRWRSTAHVPVLAYHGIDDPEQFREQIDYLARVRKPMTLDRVIDGAAGRRALPERAVLVTFDDGERSVLERGAPILRERGVPAVAFVVAGLLDTAEPFWWVEVERLVERGGATERFPGRSGEALVRALKRLPDEARLAAIEELRERAGGERPRTPQLRRDDLATLESAGVSVQSHSLTHPCLSRCDDAKAESEVTDSRRVLADALGRPPRAFAYPDGDCDERVRQAVADAGYEVAFLFDHRVSPRVPPDPLRISRVRVNSTSSLDRFAAIVSGLHPAVHRARGGR